MNKIIRPPMPPIRWEVMDTFWDMVLRPGRKEREMNEAERRRYEREMEEYNSYMDRINASRKR